MTHPRWLSSFVVAITSLSLLATVAPSTANSAPVMPEKAYAHYDRTSAKEAARVDRVPTPKISWFKPSLGAGTFRLATVRLPRDYDRPHGPTVEIALAKLPARKPEKRIGTLFVNPGGPGGSGVDMVRMADIFVSDSIRDHFDIVGFDPRGGNSSTNVRCFTSVRSQSSAMQNLGLFPWNAEKRKKYLKASRKTAQACSRVGKVTASSVSTAEVARDMDVLRRAVGDKQLTYLGFSYGTYLGEVYANLFPDRFRAMALDGVINPNAWRGSKRTGSTPMSLRLKSGEADWKILKHIFALCKQAGPDYCSLTNPEATFNSVVRKLRARHYHYMGMVFDYGDLMLDLVTVLYDQVAGPETIIDLLRIYDQISGNPNPTALKQLKKIRATAKNTAYDFIYDASLENYLAVVCTDAVQPRDPGRWRTSIAKGKATAPHFGAVWGWQDSSCATKYWKAKDEDRYTGRFDKNTKHPVLIVGNYYDPATSYASAKQTHAIMPHSYLLSSGSWGHTAYGSSGCVNDGIDNYLIYGTKPTSYCEPDYIPFAYPLDPTTRTSTQTARMTITAASGLPKADPAQQ